VTDLDLKPLIRRTVEIDWRYKHRHLPGSLSALPIIAIIYRTMGPNDTFILSKGHSCAALYAVLESYGKHPDVSLVHPERDQENGVTITAGSLGHGLPIGVGMAYANKLNGSDGVVHVLMGDGEMQEGSVYEGLVLAVRLRLHAYLKVHIDYNWWQGSEALLYSPAQAFDKIFLCEYHSGKKGQGVRMFEEHPEKSVHLVTDEEYSNIMEELK